MGETSKLRKMASLMALAACGIGLLMFMRHAAAAVPAPRTQPAPAGVTAPAKGVVIGAFEGKVVNSKTHGTYVLNHGQGTGWGWTPTDDQRVGGHSRASITIVHPGAGGTQGALQASGELNSGFISPWAGAVWFPGSRPMQPADLSSRKDLVFWAKGDPGSYSIMLMAGSARSIPVYTSFKLTKTWKQYTIPLSSFSGADLKHVYFIAFSAGTYGKFQFELDRVSLY